MLSADRSAAAVYPDDESRRTVGYLRLIVNQRHVPDEARVTVDAECIAIEWADA